MIGRDVLGAAPWRRAPLLLLRRPTVLVAVAGACLVLGVAAAVPALFLSSAGNAALQRQVSAQCLGSVGPRFQGADAGGVLPPGLTAAETAGRVAAAARRLPHVGAPVLTDRRAGPRCRGRAGACAAAAPRGGQRARGSQPRPARHGGSRHRAPAAGRGGRVTPLVTLCGVRRTFHEGRPDEVAALVDVDLTLVAGQLVVLTARPGRARAPC